MYQPVKSEVTTNTGLTISYSKDYDLASESLPLYGCSVQAVYTDATPVAAIMASASKVTAAVQATQTVTVVDYTLLAGKTLTINGTVFTEGIDWTAATSNDDTATSIAALIPTGITGTAASAIATFKNTAYGTVGNANTLATNAAVGGLTLGGATFSGGVDALFTKTAHGLITGVVGQMTTSNALPTGLITSTNYYVVVLSSSTFALASSLANAQAGTRIQFTTTGTGNQTYTPTALGGVVVKLQMSNDGTNFTDISGKTVTISTAGSVLWDLGPVTFRTLRVLETPSAGALNLTLNFNGTNTI